MKSIMGFAKKRSMPQLAKKSLSKWVRNSYKGKKSSRRVYFFMDEFTNYNDVEVGKKAILLLDRLGYEVRFLKHLESGRTYLSKGLLKNAKEIALSNVRTFYGEISKEMPLVGVEPSTILTFRDEYISLLRGDDQRKAKELSQHVFTIEEFLAREKDANHINAGAFVEDVKKIKVHGHCHQKALSSMTPTKKILEMPRGFKMQMIPSGCCGMAGSFGFEEEHYDVSMKIAELVLLPTVRKQPSEVIIAAAGTSCRHQIWDGAQKVALHPAEILYDALKPN